MRGVGVADETNRELFPVVKCTVYTSKRIYR